MSKLHIEENPTLSNSSTAKAETISKSCAAPDSGTYRVVVFDSSDSENDDPFYGNNIPDVTFSSDLNFSLGIVSTTPLKPSSKPVTVQVVKTPSRVTPVENIEPDSPMFLSLFERLKLKKEKNNFTK